MKINKTAEIILLVIIIGISLLSRSIEVLNKNYIFGFDQGRDYLAVKSIVVDHKFTLIGSEIGAGAAGLQGIFHGPFHYYFLSLPFILTKGDPYSGIVLMFLFSAISVVFAYFLGKKVFGKIGGFITALLISLAGPFISQARFVWNSHPSTLFILLAFYFTYLAFKKKKKFIFLSAFFSGFVYNFELAISIPLSVSLILFYIFIARLKSFKNYAFLFLGFIVAFSPMIFFEIRHNFMALRGLLSYMFNHRETTSFLLSSKTIADHWNSFTYAFLDIFPKHIIPPYALFLIVFVPAIYYLFKENNNKLRQFILFLFLLTPVNFFIFSFLRNSVWVFYLIDLNLAYILIFSYSISCSFKKNNYLLKFFFSLFLLVILIKSVPMLMSTFAYDYNDYGGIAKIKGKIDAIDFIYNDAKEKKFSLFVFTPPVYTYAYDYLIWWYGKRKYNYVPSQEKKGTFYLLIEQDPYKPWSYKGWLETVVKTGNVIYTKELSSGFIIQKRLGE